MQLTVAEGTGLEELLDVVLRQRASTVAVVDGSGRVVGTIEPGDHPDLFEATDRVRVAGTARQRRRRDRRVTARDLMGRAV